MAINLLDLQPHKISRDLSGYITYLYGAAKVGKTSLAAQAPNCLLLACERGYNALPNIYAQDITSWSEMRQAYRELKKPEVQEKFKVIIVDTVDLAAKYCERYICNMKSIEDLSQLGYGKGYKLMRDEFENVFNSLALLGYAVFFISHSQESVFTRADGTEYNRIVPSLSPAKVNAIIENMADIYGYAHFKSPEERVITLRSPDDSISCGSRFKYIDAEIPLSYESLVKAITKAIDKEEEEHGSEIITDAPVQIKSHEIDFDAEMATFNDLVAKIQEAAGSNFGSQWAPRIYEIVSRHLGAGKTVAEMNRNQGEQLVLIVDDLKEAVANGV